MVFFLDADARVYARYGGRDAKDADNRQSLAGLQYTMTSVLEMHAREKKEFAPKVQENPKTVRDIGNVRSRGCMHCHQVKEAINANLKRTNQWTRDLAWKFPLPENVGITLEVDRGNVVKSIGGNSPASVAGLAVGDVVQRLNGMPIHSFGDAQFALDRSPSTGTIPVAWKRGDKLLEGKLTLAEGWRKSDISWRPSMRFQIPSARLFGSDLTAEERKPLGLSEKRLAFRQKDSVHAQTQAAGIKPGDIILGVDDKPLEMDAIDFLGYVKSNYLAGDRVTVNIIREGKKLSLPMTLGR